MNRIENINKALSILNPRYLDIVDESYLHEGHNGRNSDLEYTSKNINVDKFGVDQHGLNIRHNGTSPNLIPYRFYFEIPFNYKD